MERKEKIVVALCVAATAASGILYYTHANAVLAFVVTASALALLAVIVGDATEQLGSRLGPGATGILQSGLGNLPELFVCIFALRAGLSEVVQAALIGSILGNSSSGSGPGPVPRRPQERDAEVQIRAAADDRRAHASRCVGIDRTDAGQGTSHTSPNRIWRVSIFLSPSFC